MTGIGLVMRDFVLRRQYLLERFDTLFDVNAAPSSARVTLNKCEVGMAQNPRLCASAVCAPTKPRRNPQIHIRHHLKKIVPTCLSACLCIRLRAKKITALFVFCVCVAHFFRSKINFVGRHKSHLRLKNNLHWIHNIGYTNKTQDTSFFSLES